MQVWQGYIMALLIIISMNVYGQYIIFSQIW